MLVFMICSLPDDPDQVVIDGFQSLESCEKWSPQSTEENFSVLLRLTQQKPPVEFGEFLTG